jgi:hypothetical protein
VHADASVSADASASAVAPAPRVRDLSPHVRPMGLTV